MQKSVKSERKIIKKFKMKLSIPFFGMKVDLACSWTIKWTSTTRFVSGQVRERKVSEIKKKR